MDFNNIVCTTPLGGGESEGRKSRTTGERKSEEKGKEHIMLFEEPAMCLALPYDNTEVTNISVVL